MTITTARSHLTGDESAVCACWREEDLANRAIDNNSMMAHDVLLVEF